MKGKAFRPFPNPFTYVRLSCPRGSLLVNEVHALGENSHYEPGEIVVADQQLIVACADRLLAFSAVMLPIVMLFILSRSTCSSILMAVCASVAA